MPATGHPHTTLIVIRGNSGSGKSTIARELRQRYGRGCALVEQDYLRRIVLRERDGPDALASAFIAHTVRFALDHHYHVVLEGILRADWYGGDVADLARDHRGRTHLFYLDVSLDETLGRHTTRPQAAEFTPDQMRGWYRPHDLLSLDGERVIPEGTSVEDAIALIAAVANLPLAGRDDQP